MKTLGLALLLVLTSAPLAFANDSEWLVCEGIAKADKDHSAIHVMANLLEHRGPDGATRVTDVSLFHGANEASGSFRSSDGKNVALSLATSDKKPATAFTGTATLNLDGDAHDFSLKGKLDLAFGSQKGGDWMAIDMKLQCHELDDMAIGH